MRLVNKSNKDVSIGKWSIKSLANEREIVYKFHPRQTIKAGNSVTVSLSFVRFSVFVELGSELEVVHALVSVYAWPLLLQILIGEICWRSIFVFLRKFANSKL